MQQPMNNNENHGKTGENQRETMKQHEHNMQKPCKNNEKHAKPCKTMQKQ